MSVCNPRLTLEHVQSTAQCKTVHEEFLVLLLVVAIIHGSHAY